MEITGLIAQKVIEGKGDQLNQLIDKAIEQNIDVNKIMGEGFSVGLDIVGEKFSKREYFLPDLLVSGMIVQEGLKKVKLLLAKSGAKPKAIVIAGTVLGDMHDIGKKMVCMMLEGAGFKVIDVGIDVSAEKYINAGGKNNADIIIMSALLSTTRLNMEGIIKKIRVSELSNIKIIVGGASVTQDFADSIAADGYAPDAGLAVKKVKQLLDIS